MQRKNRDCMIPTTVAPQKKPVAKTQSCFESLTEYICLHWRGKRLHKKNDKSARKRRINIKQGTKEPISKSPARSFATPRCRSLCDSASFSKGDCSLGILIRLKSRSRMAWTELGVMWISSVGLRLSNRSNGRLCGIILPVS